MANHPLYRNFDSYIRMVNKIWDRVDIHSAEILAEQANAVEDTAPASGLVLHIGHNLYHLLAFSFWREVITYKRSPSLRKGKLLSEMHKYLMSQSIKESARRYQLEEVSKSIRPPLLMTVLRSVDIRDLSDEDSNCTICKMPLANIKSRNKFREIPVKTPCGHIFGNHCICTWIRDNETCPVCRRKLLSFPASQSIAEGQQISSESPAPMPLFLCHILGTSPANADGDMAIIKVTTLEDFLLSEKE
ncbi:hypothetical protein BKA64DRAFT_742630 [Cadophora sp. MPI-SDFR-AT-0126]|nr:hypothetical protein BKA64DRAFT_742630 [Leotiomycetes sp. MPI-SDFR-AT-0126]